MESWQLIATLGSTLAAWGGMLGLMWRMHTSVRKDIDRLRGEMGSLRDELRGEIAELREVLSDRIETNEQALARVSADLAEFRGEMRGELKGVNTALLVLREDFRAHVHGVRAG